MVINSKMTAIADKIRTLLGISGTMGLDDMSSNLGAAVNECDTQADLISQIKGAIGENVSKTSSEVSEQAALIAQIKTALEGKAGGGGGGGAVLPTLTNPATATDMAEGKQLIDASGNVVTGSLPVRSGEFSKDCEGVEVYGTLLSPYCVLDSDVLMKKDTKVYVDLFSYEFGNAKPEDVAKGKTFTSESGFKVEGTAAMGGGGNVGGLTQYAKITATPDSSTSFSIVNPLGGIAKKVSIQRTVETATSSRKCQKCLIDLETGIGICEFIDTSGRARYPIVLTNGTPSNSDFKISDGTIVVYHYNSANTWDASNEYEVEIWQ